MNNSERGKSKIKEVTIARNSLREVADEMLSMAPSIQRWQIADPSEAIFVHATSAVGHLQTFVFTPANVEPRLQLEAAARLLTPNEDLHYFWEDDRWVAEDEPE